jgi:hypothetical protein
MPRRSTTIATKRYPLKSGDGSIEDLRDMIHKVCGDPLQGMAMFAKGDVVGLGFMTQAELCAPAQQATVSAMGIRPRVPSGRERALDYISPHTRYQAYSELAQYLYAKRKALEIKAEGGSAVGGVLLYLPDNGRDPKARK